MVYTIGIKRKFWFGYQKFRVTAHRTQFEIGGVELKSPRLILTLEDGATVAIADIMSRDHVVYADFEEGKKKAEKEAEEKRQAELDKKATAEVEQFMKEFQEWKAQAAKAPVVPITKQA